MDLNEICIRMDSWKTVERWNSISAKIPKLCPHCSVANRPIDISATHLAMDSSNKLLSVAHECASCHAIYYSLHKLNIDNNPFVAEFIMVYPGIKGKSFDPLFQKISPRFVSLYGEAYAAEQLDHTELASCGYRNALEVLIKDFAINQLGENPEEVKKLKLYGTIEKYLPDIALQNAADVVRIIGNDKTHYEQSYDHIEFSQFKYYMDIFEIFILAKLKAFNPPVSR